MDHESAIVFSRVFGGLGKWQGRGGGSNYIFAWVTFFFRPEPQAKIKLKRENKDSNMR